MKKEELTQEEIKQIGIQGLCRFREICNKYDLTYFLGYGTLLGTVRHKGFIPWDDDIDVWMPRKDYELLIEISKLEEDNDWIIYTNSINNRFCFPWMKMCNKNSILLPSRFNTDLLYGVSIDIFPLDSIKGNTSSEVLLNVKKSCTSYFKNRDKIKPAAIIEPGMINGLKSIIKKIYFRISTIMFISPKKLYESYEYDIKKYVDDNSSFFSCVCVLEKYDTIWEKSLFEGEKTFLEFEGDRFRVPNNYHKVLVKLYGEYMKLPPSNQRVVPHTYKSYKV